jgi:hypothetical protein
LCSSVCTFYTYTIQSGNPSALQRSGLHTSLSRDYDGTLLFAYQATSGVGAESVRVASWVGTGGNCGEGALAGVYQCDAIMSGEGLGTFTSIAYEWDAQRPHIAFYDPTAGRPWYAVRVGTGGNCGPSNSWYCTSPYTDGHDTGASMSLFLDSSAAPHLAFLDSTTEQLVYATYVGTNGNCGYSGGSFEYQWQCDVIDDVGPVAATRTVAMAADVAGRPVIAYRDASSAGPTALALAQPVEAAPPYATPNCGPVIMFYTWYCSALDAGGVFQNEAAAVSIAANDHAMAIAYHELSTVISPEGNLKVLNRWVDAMFEDGFESGDTGAWSGATP